MLLRKEIKNLNMDDDEDFHNNWSQSVEGETA